LKALRERNGRKCWGALQNHLPHQFADSLLGAYLNFEAIWHPQICAKSGAVKDGYARGHSVYGRRVDNGQRRLAIAVQRQRKAKLPSRSDCWNLSAGKLFV